MRECISPAIRNQRLPGARVIIVLYILFTEIQPKKIKSNQTNLAINATPIRFIFLNVYIYLFDNSTGQAQK